MLPIADERCRENGCFGLLVKILINSGKLHDVLRDSWYPKIKSRLFHWAGDASTFEGGGNSSFIEMVCSPNNPDGAIRRAVLDSGLSKRVHDLAYYCPQYTPMHGLTNNDIMLFTVSKAIGHAGKRIRWALVKDADLARRMVKFIGMNLIGISKDSLVHIARILQVVSNGYELPDSKGISRLFHLRASQEHQGADSERGLSMLHQHSRQGPQLRSLCRATKSLPWFWEFGLIKWTFWVLYSCQFFARNIEKRASNRGTDIFTDN